MDRLLSLTYSQTPSMCLKLWILNNPLQLHHPSAKQLFQAMLSPPWANGSEAEHAQATLCIPARGSLHSVPPPGSSLYEELHYIFARLLQCVTDRKECGEGSRLCQSQERGFPAAKALSIGNMAVLPVCHPSIDESSLNGVSKCASAWKLLIEFHGGLC